MTPLYYSLKRPFGTAGEEDDQVQNEYEEQTGFDPRLGQLIFLSLTLIAIGDVCGSLSQQTSFFNIFCSGVDFHKESCS